MAMNSTLATLTVLIGGKGPELTTRAIDEHGNNKTGIKAG